MTDTTDIKALRSEACGISRLFEAEKFIEKVIGLLEAERQRAAIIEQTSQMRLERAEAERQRADANEPVRCEGVPQHVHDMIDMQETIDELRAEIAALKAKLANPIVLPKRSVDEVMIMSGFDRQYAEGWVSANDNGIYEINAAGFTVKGE